MRKHLYGSTAPSPISMQQNIMSKNSLKENTSSLSKMRSEIHKLQPQDLEYSTIESSITNSGTNWPNEDPIVSHLDASTYLCTSETC